jgi:ubiquinone/menaquinone biosynthesis C-methylase UbiE
MARTGQRTQAVSGWSEARLGLPRVSRIRVLLFALLFLAMGGSIFAPAEAIETEAGPYVSAEPSEFGIGRFYMGREIGVIMSPEGAEWLDRGTRAREERPDLVLEAMQIEPDWVVADIGAASGYYTFRLSAKVPEGRVLAVDIQPDLLQLIEERCALAGIGNVETVLGSVEDPGLPESTVDAVLLVDSYHEFSHPREMMTAIVRALRPGGRIFLVEFRGEDAELPVPPLHKMTEAQARLELEAAGLEWVENRTVLPLHHFLVFRKP